MQAEDDISSRRFTDQFVQLDITAAYEATWSVLSRKDKAPPIPQNGLHSLTQDPTVHSWGERMEQRTKTNSYYGGLEVRVSSRGEVGGRGWTDA